MQDRPLSFLPWSLAGVLLVACAGEAFVATSTGDPTNTAGQGGTSSGQGGTSASQGGTRPPGVAPLAAAARARAAQVRAQAVTQAPRGRAVTPEREGTAAQVWAVTRGAQAAAQGPGVTAVRATAAQATAVAQGVEGVRQGPEGLEERR